MNRPERVELPAPGGDVRAPIRWIATVLWPAFLAAGVLEMLVFALVDPAQLHGPSGDTLGISAQAVYSLAFFAFWLVAAAGCAMTAWLGSTPPQQ